MHTALLVWFARPSCLSVCEKGKDGLVEVIFSSFFFDQLMHLAEIATNSIHCLLQAPVTVGMDQGL